MHGGLSGLVGEGGAGDGRGEGGAGLGCAARRVVRKWRGGAAVALLPARRARSVVVFRVLGPVHASRRTATDGLVVQSLASAGSSSVANGRSSSLPMASAPRRRADELRRPVRRRRAAPRTLVVVAPVASSQSCLAPSLTGSSSQSRRAGAGRISRLPVESESESGVAARGGRPVLALGGTPSRPGRRLHYGRLASRPIRAG